MEVRNDLDETEGNSVDVKTATDLSLRERQHSNSEDSTTFATPYESATKDIDFVPRPLRYRKRPAKFDDFDVRYI